MRDPIAVYEDDSVGSAIALAGSPTLIPRATEVTLANMRLIAAAPEMYALLVESQAGISLDWIARRDAVVSKAEGRER
jgi:hypothetical protein